VTEFAFKENFIKVVDVFFLVIFMLHFL